jgi:succinyl-CoA synthetase beta subunit
VTPGDGAGFEGVRELFATVRASGRRHLTEPEAKRLLRAAGLSVSEERLVESAGDAVQAAGELGFPVVLKVVSPDVPHKSDVGGVRLGLATPEAVEDAYGTILAAVRHASPAARIDGVLVGRQHRGLEVLLGMVTDPQFGPVMVFGLGGTAVEVLGDVTFRLIPLDERDALAMLDEIRSAPLLDGHRGSPPASRSAIVAALLGLSRLVACFPDDLEEIDVNPLLVTPDRAVAVDAMAVLRP